MMTDLLSDPVDPETIEAEARRLLEGITPGEWLCIQRNVWADDIYVSPDEGGNPEAGALLATVAINRPAGKGNAQFFKAAP